MRKEEYYKLLKELVVDRYGIDTNKLFTRNGYGLTVGRYLEVVSEIDQEFRLLNLLSRIKEKAVLESILKAAICVTLKRFLEDMEGYRDYYEYKVVKVR